MPTIRKKIKWATKKRKGGSRQWKSRWILVHVKEAGKERAAKA